MMMMTAMMTLMTKSGSSDCRLKKTASVRSAPAGQGARVVFAC